MKKIIVGLMFAALFAGCGEWNTGDKIRTECHTYANGKEVCYTDKAEMTCEVYEDNSRSCISSSEPEAIVAMLDAPDMIIDVSDEEIVAESPDSMTIVSFN